MGQQASLLSQLLPEPAPFRPYVHPSQYRCIPNVRHYSDGMQKRYSPNLCTLVIATVTLAAYISIPHMLMGLFVGSFFSRAVLTGLVILMGSLLIPAKPLRVPPVLSSYVFLCWRRYFKFSYLFEVSLDSYQDYIIAQFPHGAFPFGALLGGTFMACEYPEYPCYALAANAAFWVPIWRHVHAWLGTEVCTKTNFHRLLGKGVKGPLHHKHHHHHYGHHHHGHQQQQQQGGEQDDATPQEQQQAKSAGGTPFNCTAAALAAAADGVTAATAASPAAAAAAADSPLGPFASAALIYPKTSLTPTECLVGHQQQQQQQRGWSTLQRRTNSAPLSQRFSAAISISSSFLGFKTGHTLSDSDSSESDGVSGSESGSESVQNIDDGSWGSKGCGCGSGLRCRAGTHCAAMSCVSPRFSSSMATATGAAGGGMGGGAVAFVRTYSSDDGTSSSRSSSSSGASVCGCCGACSVLAEVQSLSMDGAACKQQQQQQQGLLTIPSDEWKSAAAAAAVDLDGDSSAALPLLGLNHQQQQQQSLLQRRLSSPGITAHPTCRQQQHLLSPDASPQQQQQLSPRSKDPQSNDQKSNWRVDPVTGARKLGVSVGLMVGGIAEMFMIRKDHERIKLKERKGFVRIALEHGTDILPVYMFGVNQALDFGPPWLQRLSRKMRASLGVIYGVWGLPIPRRVPIFMVTGAPLVVGPPMRKDHPGFAARVDELHAQFCVEIERLYYAHRAKYGHGFENRPLVIC